MLLGWIVNPWGLLISTYEMLLTSDLTYMFLFLGGRRWASEWFSTTTLWNYPSVAVFREQMILVESKVWSSWAPLVSLVVYLALIGLSFPNSKSLIVWEAPGPRAYCRLCDFVDLALKGAHPDWMSILVVPLLNCRSYSVSLLLSKGLLSFAV